MSKFGWYYPPGAANDPFAPYNQDFDDENCAYCGNPLPDDVTGFSESGEDAVNDGFCNTKCLKDWEDNGEYPSEDYGKPHLTDKQKEDIKEVHNIICEYNRMQANKKYSDRCAPITVLNDMNLPDGDFIWDNDEPGDPYVYCCGEKDCPVQWHLSYDTMTIKRKDDILSIEINTGDESGNWDFECGFYTKEKGDQQEIDNWNASDIGYWFGAAKQDEYFISWAEYWIDAAQTGEDPCEQAMIFDNTDWASYCIKAAKDNIKYIECRLD